MKDTTLNPMQEESLRMIVASGDLLLATVNDVLDFAKLETENIETDVKRSSLHETLSAILYSIESKAQDRQLSIKTMYDTALPEFVQMDSRRVQQILFNLLGNAIKFSNNGSVVEFSVGMVA